jgi:hypothetical protein
MRAWALGVIVACAVGAPALSQQAPAPKAAAPATVADFVAAYKRAGSPRMLVHADLAGGTSAQAAAGAQSARSLGAEVERALSQPGVVMVRGMKPLDAEQVRVLRAGDSMAGARLLGNAADADVVLYLRVVETAGAGYTGTFVLADLRRGLALGRHAWDMVPEEGGGVAAGAVRAQAGVIVSKVSEQFARAYPPGGSPVNARRAIVRVAGAYSPEDLAALREGLNAAPGVKAGSAVVRAEDRSGEVHVATLDVVFGGDAEELRRLVHRTVIDQMGMVSEPIDGREGAVAVRLGPLGLSAREKMLVGGSKSSRASAERDRLALAYANAGAPKVAVMFNRAEQAPGAGEGVRVEVGERTRAVPAGPGRESVSGASQSGADAMVMLETSVSERLAQLGVQVRPLSAAQERLAAAPEFKEKAWEDRELAVALGREAEVDVVVCGVATTAEGRVKLSVRAWDVGTGEVLERVEVEGQAPPGEGAELNRRAEELAAMATGKLTAVLAERWEAAPRK